MGVSPGMIPIKREKQAKSPFSGRNNSCSKRGPVHSRLQGKDLRKLTELQKKV